MAVAWLGTVPFCPGEVKRRRVVNGLHGAETSPPHVIDGGGVGKTGNGCFPSMACQAAFRFPKAQMSLASQARTDAPSAPTCFASQSMPNNVVSARDARVVRKTTGTPLPLATG